MKKEIKKGYKAFKKGLKCLDFQYEEGKEYEIKGNPSLCNKGFHYCENPLDVLNYYDLCDSEFAEIEDSGDTLTDGQKNVTNKIKIKAKLDLKGFIKASIDFLFEKTKEVKGENIQAASGYSSKLAASSYSSKLAASGDSSQLAASGDSSKLAASGYSSKLAASGDYSKLAMEGSDSVGANIGISGIIKGKKGCWITLAEYENNKPVCVKSAKIDGKKLKEDTWYRLTDGKFTEA